MAEITIIGTGSMAMFLGGRLARAGVKVRFLGSWKECIQAINQDGLCIVEEGRSAYFPAEAFFEPEQLKGTQLALVLVKSWQTERASDQLKELLSDDGVALTLQNGLGNGEILSDALGAERTALGVTTYGATSLGPGKVRPGGEGIISVQEHDRLPAMIDVLKRGGLKLQQLPDISELIWQKVVINVAINPLTGLLGVKNGELLESPAARQLMGLAAREAAAVAQAGGVTLNGSDPALAAEAVAAATGNNLSSMLQDLKRGAPTEIDVLCAKVVSLGKALSISTPVNELLTMLVRAKVDLSRKEK